MSNLKELDVFDNQENIVISPDLKVRHKDSQYEYTVDSITKDEEGQTIVLLRLPDKARSGIETPPLEEPELMKDLGSGKVLYEVDPSIEIYEPSEEDVSDDDLLAVPQEEFEKEYEVK